jgi:hypothetical protein
MTAATEALSYEASLIAEAQAVFTRARLLPGWDHDEFVRDCFWDLTVRLKRYHDLCRGIVPAWFPGIPAGPEGRDRALRDAAESAGETAQELVILLPAAAAEGEMT